MHQRAAGSNQPHRVFERNDVRRASGSNFSQAVPDHCVWHDAPGFHKFGQGILDRKQRRLGVVGAVDQRIIAVPAKITSSKPCSRYGSAKRMTTIHGIPKNGVRAI